MIVPAGQQIQQDPNEPGKWQVVTVSTSGAAPAAPAGECEASKARAGAASPGKQRLLKRVACTCPNCDQGEKLVS